MPSAISKRADAYKVEIFIGRGDKQMYQVDDLCIAFCTKVGLCVTVTQTSFAFRGGACDGAIIGLINYARFPKSQEEIWNIAIELANYLKLEMGQGSYTIQDHEESYFFSTRVEDGCDG